MISVDEAKKTILECTETLAYESIAFQDALDRVLAENIYSSEDVPFFNNSAMDGYAVVASALKGASSAEPSMLSLKGKIPAGFFSEDIVKGNTAMKIMTGAPVPVGADAVVPVEFTETEGNFVKILREAIKWENIRFAGEDIKNGELVIPKGKMLGPAEIGMFAALNITSAKVTKKPSIGILATGDELMNPGEKLSPGKIRNINSYCLSSLALRHGCIPLNLGFAKDNIKEIKSKLELGKNCDILIVSGGVSMGDYDFVKKSLSDMGMKERFWKVAIKPGKPVLFGTMGHTLIFGLPGNPVSSMVAFEEFVLPAIYKLQGRSKKPWRELKALLEGNIKKEAGLMHVIRGKTFINEGRVCVRTTGLQSSGIFSSMVASDCFIIVPEEVTEVRNGEEVLLQFTNGMGE